ncbi:MAG: CBS domain-containing protein [Nitrososphaeraceae archaeon]
MGGKNTGPESMSISSIMVTELKTAKETQSIQEVCRTMIENKIGSTVIIKDSSFNTKDNRLIDILTRRDIVRAI